MRILHVLPSYAVDWGGPPKIAYQIAEGTRHTNQVDILCSYTPGEKLVNMPAGVRLISCKRNWFHRFWRGYSPEMKVYLQHHLHEYDIVHVHEIWLYHLYAVGTVAIPKKVPFIVTPHGELDEWALNYKGAKKKFFSWLFQKRILKKASAIHVGTQKETGEVKKYLNNNEPPIFEIPNALLDPSFKLEADSTALPFNYKEEPYILFLSRINIKKGCDLLLKAFAKWKQNDEYKLVLAGPAEPLEYLLELKDLAGKLGIADRVLFVGSVHGKSKQALLENASLFALTSYAEGFPVAILEALQAGCPLLLSNKCGFDQFLESQQVAIVCKVTPESVLECLEKFETLTPLQITAIRQKGPLIIKEFYAGETVSKQYMNMYEQVLSTAKNRCRPANN